MTTAPITASMLYSLVSCPHRVMSQMRAPNRFRGYFGATRAAEAAGDRKKAALYDGKLLALAKHADSARPEIAQAKAFVAKG